MKAAANAVQRAQYDKLNGDSEITSTHGAAVYDHGGVPEGTTYPYITVGDITSEDWSTMNNAGEIIDATLHIWDKERGYKLANEILNRCNELLGDTSLLGVPYIDDTWVLARSEYRQYSRVPDPGRGVVHVQVTYRVWMQEA